MSLFNQKVYYYLNYMYMSFFNLYKLFYIGLVMSLFKQKVYYYLNYMYMSLFNLFKLCFIQTWLCHYLNYITTSLLKLCNDYLNNRYIAYI